MADRDEALGRRGTRCAARRTAPGSLFINLTINLWRGWTLLLRGELEEAEASLYAAVDETIRWGTERGRLRRTRRRSSR